VEDIHRRVRERVSRDLHGELWGSWQQPSAGMGVGREAGGQRIRYQGIMCVAEPRLRLISP
jgi:hypothetical protein